MFKAENCMAQARAKLILKSGLLFDRILVNYLTFLNYIKKLADYSHKT